MHLLPGSAELHSLTLSSCGWVDEVQAQLWQWASSSGSSAAAPAGAYVSGIAGSTGLVACSWGPSWLRAVYQVVCALEFWTMWGREGQNAYLIQNSDLTNP